MKNYIVGHKIPDSDSICSAISLSYLLEKVENNVYIPARQGDINLETKFILDTFKFDLPILKNNFKNENVWLVDHSDLLQAPDDILEANVLGIVDHHKLGDITTTNPLECMIKPVGCSCTIIFQMFKFNNVEIPANIAAAMLCAILSDTVIFKSPTCTTADIKTAENLAHIAGITDIKKLGMDLFKQKDNIDSFSIEELLFRDFKLFNMNNNKIGVAQLEVTDFNLFKGMNQTFLSEMKVITEKQDLHSFILVISDILKEDSILLSTSDDISLIENAFNAKFSNDLIYLKDTLSRKLQIIPPLQKEFNK
jgi:manganese-dependent inorganic pyrophosphatase